MKTKICVTCKKPFNPSSRHKDCPKCREEKQKIACSACEELIWNNATICIKCFNANKIGNNLENNLRTRRLTGKGYYRLSNGVFEHRYIFEQHLGRKLLKGENIHHKNGVKTDNRISNLELWVTSQPSGQRPEDLLVWADEIIKRYRNSA